MAQRHSPRGADERIDLFVTLRDWLRHAISRFESAGLVYGHGATSALDDAAFLILEGLRLPVDTLDPFLDARLLRAERERLAGLIDARVATRKPSPYLVNRAYIQGVPFYVDERVIVPRSFIGELLGRSSAELEALTGDPLAIASVLDLCAGGGSLAILAARAFPNARVDAAEVSAGALEVAGRNVAEHGLEDRVTLFHGDLFGPLAGRRYDLILTNPPYVDAEAVAAFPPEYAAEPKLAHAGGADGLTIVRCILAEARAHLTDEGTLICEVGRGGPLLAAEFPDMPFVWLDTEASEGEVFLLRAPDLPQRPAKAARRPKAKR